MSPSEGLTEGHCRCNYYSCSPADASDQITSRDVRSRRVIFFCCAAVMIFMVLPTTLLQRKRDLWQLGSVPCGGHCNFFHHLPHVANGFPKPLPQLQHLKAQHRGAKIMAQPEPEDPLVSPDVGTAIVAMPETLVVHVAGDDADTEVARRKFTYFPMSPSMKVALKEVFGLTYPTDLQELCILPALDDFDVIGQALPGSGRKLATLIPVIEKLIQTPGWSSRDRVAAVILASSRKRVMKLVDTASYLLQFTKINLGTLVSGGVLEMDYEQLRGDVDLLITTPGRFIELLTFKSDLKSKFENTHTLVVEDMDLMLSIGLWPDVQGILQYLPAPRWRQTLLFSSTITPQILTVGSRITRTEATQVVKLLHDNGPLPPPAHIKRIAVVVSLTEQLAVLHSLVRTAMEQEGHKVIVYFPTSRFCQLYADIFRQQRYRIMEINGKMTLEYRTTVWQALRTEEEAVMFTSLAPPFGLDMNASCVIQVGISMSNEQYILSISPPTLEGPAGVQKSIVLLAEFEASYLQYLTPFNIERVAPSTDAIDQEFQENALRELRANSEPTMPFNVYLSFLTFYSPLERIHHQPREQVVMIANTWLRWLFGLEELPKLSAHIAYMAGVFNVPGVPLMDLPRAPPKLMKKKSRRTK